MSATFEFDADDLIAAIERLVPDLNDAAGEAMAFGADLATAEAKRLAPKGPTGLLSNSILSLPVLGTFTNGTLEVDVLAGAPYALPVEEGTQAHDIIPRFRRALRFPGPGGFTFAKKVRHPGTAPQPFMAPALERAADPLVAALRSQIERTMRKHGF